MKLFRYCEENRVSAEFTKLNTHTQLYCSYSEAERLNVNQILKETLFKVMQEAKLTSARRIREISNEIEIVINDINCMFPPSEMRQLLRKVENLENKKLEHLHNTKLMKLHKLINQPGLKNRIGLEKIKISNQNKSENN